MGRPFPCTSRPQPPLRTGTSTSSVRSRADRRSRLGVEAFHEGVGGALDGAGLLAEASAGPGVSAPPPGRVEDLGAEELAERYAGTAMWAETRVIAGMSPLTTTHRNQTFPDVPCDGCAMKQHPGATGCSASRYNRLPCGHDDRGPGPQRHPPTLDPTDPAPVVVGGTGWEWADPSPVRRDHNLHFEREPLLLRSALGLIVGHASVSRRSMKVWAGHSTGQGCWPRRRQVPGSPHRRRVVFSTASPTA